MFALNNRLTATLGFDMTEFGFGEKFQGDANIGILIAELCTAFIVFSVAVGGVGVMI